MSKIFEHFVHQQLLEYCLACDAIPDDQYGFLPGRSTTWQLLTVLDEWECHLDHGNGIHACFLGIAKAFDRVDHPWLLKKLDGIASNAMTRIETISCFSVREPGAALSPLAIHFEGIQISVFC